MPVLAGGTGLSQHRSPGLSSAEMPEAVQPTSAVVEEGQEHFGRRDGEALVLPQRGWAGLPRVPGPLWAGRDGSSRSLGNNKRRRNYSQVTF